MTEDLEETLSRPVPQGYERIGSWDVSLKIPELFRQQFKADCKSFAKGKVPDRFKTYCITGDECCFIEHRLFASSMKLPPDPFVAIGSYVTGKPVDRHDKVKHRGRIKEKNRLFLVGDFTDDKKLMKMRHEEIHALFEPHENAYDVMLTIDCETKEARIDSTPEMLEHFKRYRKLI